MKMQTNDRNPLGPISYRADVDGLRAFSVLSVLLYHADLFGVTGGFVGVDVFFVISGFLITKIVMSEIEIGHFSIRSFYERRARRILPALIVVISSTLIASSFILTPSEFETVAWSSLAATFFSSNIYFWATGDYFGAHEIRPLLHTWSLGVEEQFYILFPLLLLWLSRYGRRSLICVILVLAALSLAAANVSMNKDLTAEAFFFPHLRAWELLVGAIIATLPSFSNARSVFRELAALTGLGLIAFASVTYQADMEFPGVSAIVPVLGAALVIVFEAPDRGIVSLLVRNKISVWLGKISYSVYLWHFPILVLADYYLLGDSTPVQRAALLILSIFLAVLSYLFIEEPFRRSRWSPRRVWLTTMAGVFGLTSMSGAVVVSDGLPARFSVEELRYANMLDKEQYFEIYDRGGCFLDSHQRAEDYDLTNCSGGGVKGGVLIWGDSFAANLYPGLSQTLSEPVRQYTATSCRPIDQTHSRCGPFFENFGMVAKTMEPDVILLIGFWSSRLQKLGEAVFEEKLRVAINYAKSKGEIVVVAGQSPTYGVALPHLARLRPEYRVDGTVKLEARNHSHVNEVLERVAVAEDVEFFDFYSRCDGFECIAFADGEPFHWDGGHMTLSGSLHYADALGAFVHELTDKAAKGADR